MVNVFAMIEIVKRVHLHYMVLALNVMWDMLFLLIIHVDAKLIIVYYVMIIFVMFVKGDIFYLNLELHVNLVMIIKMENIATIFIAIYV